MAVVHLVLMVLVVGSEAGSERQRENRSGGGSGLAAVVHRNSGQYSHARSVVVILFHFDHSAARDFESTIKRKKQKRNQKPRRRTSSHT